MLKIIGSGCACMCIVQKIRLFLKIETRVLYCPRGTEKYKCISKTNPDAKMLRRFKVDPV